MEVQTRSGALYRHFDADNKLLYVGASISVFNRLAQHRDHSHWFSRIRRVEIEHFETRSDAFEAERTAILGEQPECNINLKKAKPLPKNKRFQAVAEENTLEVNNEKIIIRELVLHPLYSLRDAADQLCISEGHLKRLMLEGRIQYVVQGTRATPRKFVTGWHLLEYIKSLGKTIA